MRPRKKKTAVPNNRVPMVKTERGDRVREAKVGERRARRAAVVVAEKVESKAEFKERGGELQTG